MNHMRRYIRAAAVVRELKEQGLDDNDKRLIEAREDVLDAWSCLTLDELPMVRTTRAVFSSTSGSD